MTQNKAHKTAVRQRMAETGEPYSVARHMVEAGQVPPEPPEPPETGRYATPRDDRWYARVAEEAGISVELFKAQEEAATAADLADEALQRAEAAQQRADLAQERAEQAEEVAELAQAAADLAAEAAELTRSRADEEERERAQQRADEADLARDRAQEAAGLAQEQAERAQELAHRAEEMADEAEALADELAAEPGGEDADDEDYDEDGPAAWRYRNRDWDRGAREHGPHAAVPDWSRVDELSGRLHDRLDRYRLRLELARERAEQMIGQAERLVSAVVHVEPEHTDRG